jgi:bacteriorhodopsin
MAFSTTSKVIGSNMIIIYATSTAMVFYGGLFVYYIFLASRYIRTLQARSMYYTTAIIPLIPLTLYGMNLIEYTMCEKPIDSDYLNNYFIEWCFTTPLFIINLTRIIPIRLSTQLFLSFLAFLTNMIGFASHVSEDLTTKLQLYSVACVLFIGLCAYLIGMYILQKKSVYLANALEQNSISVFKILVRVILASWSVYPIVFIVYELGHLNHEQTAIIFTCLDFLAKGIFTAILIGHQEITNRRNTITAQLTQRVARVVPVETDEFEDREQSISTISMSQEYVATDMNSRFPSQMSV